MPLPEDKLEAPPRLRPIPPHLVAQDDSRWPAAASLSAHEAPPRSCAPSHFKFLPPLRPSLSHASAPASALEVMAKMRALLLGLQA